MANTFGTVKTGWQWLEIPDPDNAGQVIRPAAGVVIQVRDLFTLADCGDQTSEIYGYFNFTLDDTHPIIEVSADGGDNWTTLISNEAMVAITQLGPEALAAVAAAAEVTARMDALDDLMGVAGGIATLDANGHLEISQAAGIAPVKQNSDGTWTIPTTTNSQIFVKWVPATAAPAMDDWDVTIDTNTDLGA
jgi:hypothetical protein